eukprot:9426405-Karenia_brevis.AAC.1
MKLANKHPAPLLHMLKMRLLGVQQTQHNLELERPREVGDMKGSGHQEADRRGRHEEAHVPTVLGARRRVHLRKQLL